MKQKGTSLPETYAFIDSQNLNLGVQRMGWKMDWRKFREYLRTTYNVTKAYMFIGYMLENESLYERMYELGFLVVLKPTVDITSSHEANHEPKPTAPREIIPLEITPTTQPVVHEVAALKEKTQVKGNVDTELVLYAMKELPNYNKAIIVSGDGDFFSLAEYLRSQDKLAHILTPNWQYSTLLKEFDDVIVRIDQLRNQLAYRDHKKLRSIKN